MTVNPGSNWSRSTARSRPEVQPVTTLFTNLPNHMQPLMCLDVGDRVVIARLDCAP